MNYKQSEAWTLTSDAELQYHKKNIDYNQFYVIEIDDVKCNNLHEVSDDNCGYTVMNKMINSDNQFRI